MTKTGPAGAIVYRFEVSQSSAFGSVLAVATASEQSGGTTSATINANLGNGNYFWRVQASDPSNAITTAYSSVSPFTVQLFNLANANIWDNPRRLQELGRGGDDHEHRLHRRRHPGRLRQAGRSRPLA